MELSSIITTCIIKQSTFGYSKLPSVPCFEVSLIFFECGWNLFLLNLAPTENGEIALHMQVRSDPEFPDVYSYQTQHCSLTRVR